MSTLFPTLDWDKSISDLQKEADKLNEPSRDITMAIGRIEERLREMNFEHEAWIKVNNAIYNEVGTEDIELGWGHFNTKWCFLVRDVKVEAYVTSIGNSRLPRFRALAEIPGLLEHLIKSAGAMSSFVNQATKIAKVVNDSYKIPEESDA